MPKTRAKRATLYVRSSHADRTTENQRRELTKVAKQAGWAIASVYENSGVSGARNREGCPGFNRMLQDADRREFDVIMAWPLDRLGRSLQHLVAFPEEVHGSRLTAICMSQASTQRRLQAMPFSRCLRLSLSLSRP